MKKIKTNSKDSVRDRNKNLKGSSVRRLTAFLLHGFSLFHSSKKPEFTEFPSPCHNDATVDSGYTFYKE
jgi:hypothetical protein